MKITSILFITLQLLAGWQANAQHKDALNARFNTMTRETSPEKNVAAIAALIKAFKLDTIKDAGDIDIMKGITALTFLKVKDFPHFEVYISQIKNPFNQTSYLNMAVNELINNKTSLTYAELTAKKTVDLYHSFKDDPSARPADFPLQDWNRFMSMAQYPYYRSYAEILHINKKDTIALDYIEKAFSYLPLDKTDQSSAELYAALLEANHREDDAYDILLNSASTGNASLQMQQQLRRLLIKRTGNAVQVTHFLDSLQRNIVQAYKQELMNKMIKDIAAPGFTLTNTEGERISLADIKGKVVVLDFWATWCAPCKAAMPAMEQLKHTHPELCLLYVATMEKGADAISRINQYLKKHMHPTSTLIDVPVAGHPDRFTTAGAYHVKSIPCRAVIDKKGKLRFLSEGYTSDTALINEMEAMIDIAKEQ
ncbi:TlpA family protein disulfide reductase [Chitinophaga pinensis]|uniref:Alkyl hydroperoxide reductase/ Thiol specific antioxidant/ Mal allergen n=1 Tax=Chitinophaga pinensis (strain ATCC 43595 / DSM 2588 / LMG 13176 / NBRC 15968 / NCIMB 11800 / UQM 2034) TaxID=485918 RepID=A0A979GVU6_CHIPD|nr:TlpA disulfide reductase family protein [Chitinophaga pinensis]ACU60140.1 alkyl hydroperoxide reductase/ Thiol specific antioxidant/ Mal allergen [Chitinophaga pinensis DSM 2588]